MINAFVVCNENYLSFIYNSTGTISIQLKQISSESLKEYNSVYGTNYDVSDCSHFIVDAHGNEKESTIDSILTFDNNTEIWIYVLNKDKQKDSDDSENSEISRTVEDVDTIKKLINIGQYFEMKCDFVNATLFYLVSSNGIPFFAKMIKKSYDDILINKAKALIQEQYTEEIDLFLRFFERKETNYIKLCDKLENYINYPCKRTEHIIKILNKEQPYLLFKILLKNYKLFRYFPIPCKNEQIYNQLICNLMSANDTSPILWEFCHNFVKYGEIDKGIQLLGTDYPMHKCSFVEIRKICWIKLIDHDFQNLQLNLNSFFQNNLVLQIESFPIVKLHKIFLNRGNKKNNYSNQVADFIPIKTVDSKTIHIFCLILITLSFLYLSGCFQEFAIASRLIPNEDIQFKNETVPVELDLYLKLLKKKKFALNDKTSNKTFLLIGDEQCLSDEYIGFIHPIPNLQIWKLRKGNHCFEKRAFWNRVKEACKFKGLLITLGKSDLQYSIPKLMEKYALDLYPSFSSTLKTIIDIYLNVLSKIHRKYPNLLIYVGEIISDTSKEHLQENSFNNMLKKSLPEYVHLYTYSDTASK